MLAGYCVFAEAKPGVKLSPCPLTLPFDSAKPGVAKPGINKADGPQRLVRIGFPGMVLIPDGGDVLDPEGVAIVNAEAVPVAVLGLLGQQPDKTPVSSLRDRSLLTRVQQPSASSSRPRSRCTVPALLRASALSSCTSGAVTCRICNTA